MSEAREFQQAYWNELIALRAHVGYCERLRIDQARKNWWLTAFLAITSTGSIGGWVIWSRVPWLWSTLIAVSHVAMTLKPLLPWERRISTLSPLIRRLEELVLAAERRWYDVAEGLMTARRIHEETMQLRAEKLAIAHRYLEDAPLPRRPRLLVDAEEEAMMGAARSFGSPRPFGRRQE